jgi:hypothetical protein
LFGFFLKRGRWRIGEMEKLEVGMQERQQGSRMGKWDA